MARLSGKTFTAQLSQFKGKTVAKVEKIVRDSVQDVLEGAQTTARGISVGGTLIPGRIPVASGDLVNSLVSTVGGAGSSGSASYVTAIAGYEIGEFMRFEWTQIYALPIEVGFGTYIGAQFVGINAAKFSEHVERNARLAGD